MQDSNPLAITFDELVLWRDGGQAVVSLRSRGRWVRLLEGAVAELFHESCDADELRGLLEEKNPKRIANSDRPDLPSKPGMEAAE